MKSGRNDDPKAIQRARRLRSDTTLVEKVVWFRLSNTQTGFRFRRQYPAGPFILDFYCPQVRLAVEIDGPHHKLQREKDQERDRILAELGIVVLRISVDLAYSNPDDAVELILAACRNAEAGLIDH